MSACQPIKFFLFWACTRSLIHSSTAAGCHAWNTKANCVTLLVRSGGQSLTLLRVYQTARSQIALSSGVCSFSFIPFPFPIITSEGQIFSPIVTVRCPYKSIGPCGGSHQMGHLHPRPPGGRWENTAGCQSGLRAERRREESEKKKKWVLMGEGCTVTFL